MINTETEYDVVRKFETEIITQNKLIELENELDAMSAENIQLKATIKELKSQLGQK